METLCKLRLLCCVLAIGLCTTVSAQYEEPIVINDNYVPYEYEAVRGTPIQIGRPPSGYGSVLFETNPSGASVFINDIYQGVTPLLVNSVQDGSYDVRFEKEGYLNYYAAFDVAATLQSHVTAGLVPRQHYFFDKQELYTTVVFEGSQVNAQGWGVGNSWGGYFRNINLEQTMIVHIGVSNTVSFEGSVGYGFILGHLNRFRLTPQIGFSGIWFDNVETANSYWSGYLRGALNLKCGITEQYAASATLLYDRTGLGFRVGVLFFVN